MFRAVKTEYHGCQNIHGLISIAYLQIGRIRIVGTVNKETRVGTTCRKPSHCFICTRIIDRMIVFLIVALWGGVVESTPHPCCTPLQYEAYVSINGGYANVDGGNANPQEVGIVFNYMSLHITALVRLFSKK